MALRSAGWMGLSSVARGQEQSRAASSQHSEPAGAPRHAAKARRYAHTGRQRGDQQVDVDARDAAPPAGQLSRACTRTRAAGERQRRGVAAAAPALLRRTATWRTGRADGPRALPVASSGS